MKKISAFFAGVILFITALFGLSACGNGGASDRIDVYMPDGAPALAMAKLMSEDEQFGDNVKYNVVDASIISRQVTGKNPAADICILPVTTASTVIGDGSVYKMLGTVTHGNLYMLSVDGEQVTADNAEQVLTGKKVGIVNIAAFPGQMFKLLMSKMEMTVNELTSVNDSVDGEKVNIVNVEPTQVGGASNTCDYYVIAEQAASARKKATSSTDNPVDFAGDLQELYGGDGYPQAVLVAKNSLIEKKPEFIASFMQAMKDNKEWLEDDTTTVDMITSAISSHLPEGAGATFNTANLDKDIIGRCSVDFTPSSECKEEVKAFLTLMSQSVAGAASPVEDGFFYINED